MRTLLWLVLSSLPLAAQIDPNKLIDLTYSFDEKAIYWPTAKAFQFERESWGPSAGGYWYSAGRYSASEHGGTHFDSPIHFAKGQLTTDQIPVSKLVAKAVVIDVSTACNNHPDYVVNAADLQKWEKAHGAIPRGSVAVIRTGWGRFWGDKKRYMGTDKPGDVAGLHFPGVSKEAATLLRQRGIVALGIDTASMDYGQSKDFITHQILNGAGIFGIENIANVEKLPVTGATILALPMKIAGGSGGPARVIALLP